MNTRSLLRAARQAGWRLEDLRQGCLRWLRGGALHEPLPASGCRGRVAFLEPSGILEKGGPVACRLRVRNHGSHTWSSRGRRPVLLSARWLSRLEEDLGLGEGWAALPRPLAPGQEATVALRLTAPDALGDYILHCELVQQPDTPFGARGCPPVRQACRVTGRREEDIDYRRWYAGQDLRRDYWTIVGPTARPDFERLGPVKLQLLRDHGLTPDARILDVGCGTGLLTAALEGFLSDRGLYWGTDIGAEAVSFCRARFRRPNFAFVQNGMTTIPLDGLSFDFIVFFSVFTHMFPHETALLLAEAKRLLAPGGVIFADVFTSPQVSQYAGNRGAVEVNREYFLGLVDGCGLDAVGVLSQPWQRFARREFFKFQATNRMASGAC